MWSRRRFLATSTFGAVGAAFCGGTAAGLRPALAQSSPSGAGLLDPLGVPKFAVPLPDALAPAFRFPADPAVGIQQITQDLGLDGLAGQGAPTTLYGYGTAALPATYPGRTFEVSGGQSVTWSNQLPPGPHFLPVDRTIHTAETDCGEAAFDLATEVPIVTHLHGGHTDGIYDGNPECGQMAAQGQTQTGGPVVYDAQEAGTLWYHDHALGLTRLNVYAGLAGFYIVRDEYDTGTADNPLGLPAWPYEQLIVIQDRMFDVDFQLHLPSDPATATALFGEADYPDPTIMAEFFGDHILVNGQAWPMLEVEPRLYRLRLLNGCDTRFLTLYAPGLSFQVIGTDQGLLDAPVRTNRLSLAPGERIDTLVDFGAAGGRTIILRNSAPGTFRRPLVIDPRTTGQIMGFRVGTTVTNAANNIAPTALRGGSGPAPLPDLLPLVSNVRQVALYEEEDELDRLQPQLGTLAQAYGWSEETTEIIDFGATEMWEIYNLTPDAHPIHLHLVKFRIVDRQRIDVTRFVPGAAPPLRAAPQPPAPGEDGWKDTVQVPPGTVTRIVASFDKVGQWVWHCHILSHEDHEMMRRFVVS